MTEETKVAKNDVTPCPEIDVLLSHPELEVYHEFSLIVDPPILVTALCMSDVDVEDSGPE